MATIAAAESRSAHRFTLDNTGASKPNGPQRTGCTCGRGAWIGRVAKILGVENYAPSMGALRSDQAISGPSNRFTDLVEVGEQASRRTVRRRFFRALNVCDTPQKRWPARAGRGIGGAAGQEYGIGSSLRWTPFLRVEGCDQNTMLPRAL